MKRQIIERILINSHISNFLGLINDYAPFERQFFLPGYYGSLSGRTVHDLSIVLVPK